MIDAIDTVSTKLAIAEWAERTATPLIASMGGANKLDPEKLRICDIAQTSHDPLARIIRKECRRRGIRHLTVLSSFEVPHPLPVTGADADTVGPSNEGQRPTLGTASYLPPIMGQMIAGEVLRHISGLGAGDDVSAALAMHDAAQKGRLAGKRSGRA